MKRIVIRRPGGHEALELIEEADPAIRPDQVLVRVAAAGVNYADVLTRMGYYEAAKGLYPLTPGFEFAGTVEKAGPQVRSLRSGDRVFGISRFGAYASHVAAEEDRLWPCPQGWEMADCAAFPAVFLTAYYGLHKAAKVEPGETVLVHSAAGGAGGAFLQLSRVAGVKTVAVVGSPRKVERCRELGAAAVIDRSREDLWRRAKEASPAGYDAIFDANGVSSLREGFRHLAPGGRLVVYGFAEILPRGKDKPGLLELAWNYLRVPRFSPLEMTTTNKGVVGFNVIFLFHRLDLAGRAMKDLLGWIGEGKIKKAPLTLFPAERAAQAHQALESGETVGKLVLTF